jgi:hypothetical protein
MIFWIFILGALFGFLCGLTAAYYSIATKTSEEIYAIANKFVLEAKRRN